MIFYPKDSFITFTFPTNAQGGSNIMYEKFSTTLFYWNMAQFEDLFSDEIHTLFTIE